MSFEIPIVVFMFKRDAILQIIDRIRVVKPRKLYVLADNGRNDEEKMLASKCRQLVESSIDWDCELIKNYAEDNRGVYENIGCGAKWVLSKEKWAIFLEDDNLPEVSFFRYCEELLKKYESNEKVLWICGTNYLGEYQTKDNSDYMFTQHLLPCGWASWSSKFNNYYSCDLKECADLKNIKATKKNYIYKQLYYQYRNMWMAEYRRSEKGMKPRSWDYQMDFTLKYYNLYGISPAKNQIKNIGVDELSEHGGTTYANEMTRRFCSMDSYSIEFPLKDPDKVEINKDYERRIGKVLLLPLASRVKMFAAIAIKKALRIPLGHPLRGRV